MSKRSIIISGGELDEALTLSVLNQQEERCVIAVDKGVEFLYYHQIMPDYIVGDFDSTKEVRWIIIRIKQMFLFGSTIR